MPGKTFPVFLALYTGHDYHAMPLYTAVNISIDKNRIKPSLFQRIFIFNCNPTDLASTYYNGPFSVFIAS
jgi:hypothetical protein